MRLIDADATKADIEKFNRPLCDGYHMKDYVLNQIITDIENQPTVKAIPIEWIEDWQNKNKWEYESFFRMKDGRPRYAIESMLDDWEKESGSRKGEEEK